MIDRFGCQLACSDPASPAAWDEAWERYLHFRGSPLGALADASQHDDEFVLGPVMTGLYSVLAGTPLDAPVVVDSLDRARRRVHADDRRGLGHLEAFEHVCRGDFTAAADAFARQAGPTGPTNPSGASAGGDFAALRFAHDLYLHVGAAERRCAAEAELLAAWPADDPHRGFLSGMHAFSLTEVGRHDEALRLGTEALAADPEDLWARHALAHVFENADDTPRSLELLADTVDLWADQDLLAVHIWWHLGLRLIASGDIAEALAVFDARLPDASTAFQLCDQTSLLWRAEHAGARIGGRWDELADRSDPAAEPCGEPADRWDVLADRWDQVAERHTCAFIDLHAALAYIRSPLHPGADRWFAGLAAREHKGHEIDDVFAGVAIPLITALRDGDPSAFADGALLAAVHRIGGSEAQRRIVPMAVEHLAGAASRPGASAQQGASIPSGAASRPGVSAQQGASIPSGDASRPGAPTACTNARPDTPPPTGTPYPADTPAHAGDQAPVPAPASPAAAAPPHGSALAGDPACIEPAAGPVSTGRSSITAEAGWSRA